MKKRFTTIFTITVAAVLVSSIAYAAKKKLRTKSEPLTPDVSEVDLAAALMDAKGDSRHKPTKTGDTGKNSDKELKELTITKES